MQLRVSIVKDKRKAVVIQKITLPDSADVGASNRKAYLNASLLHNTSLAPWRVWARSITVQVTVPMWCIFKLPWMAWQMVPTRQLWQRQKLKAYSKLFLLKIQEPEHFCRLDDKLSQTKYMEPIKADMKHTIYIRILNSSRTTTLLAYLIWAASVVLFNLLVKLLQFLQPLHHLIFPQFLPSETSYLMLAGCTSISSSPYAPQTTTYHPDHGTTCSSTPFPVIFFIGDH